jgi:Tfp pilus assembly protein PilO
MVTLFFFAGVRPLLQNRADAAGQKIKLEQQQRLAGSAEALVRSQAAKLGALQAALATDPLRLQEARFINGKLAKISVLADARKLQIKELEPQHSVVEVPFEIVPINLAGSGTFRNCALFVHDMHESMPDVGFVAMQIEGNPQIPSAESTFKFEMQWYAGLSEKTRDQQSSPAPGERAVISDVEPQK